MVEHVQVSIANAWKQSAYFSFLAFRYNIFVQSSSEPSMNDILFPPQIVQFASNCAICMQTQVAEYKQLKDTLNRIPSFRKPEQTEQQNITQVAHSPQGDSATRDKLPGEPREVRGMNWSSVVRSLSLSSCPQVNCSKYCQL